MYSQRCFCREMVVGFVVIVLHGSVTGYCSLFPVLRVLLVVCMFTRPSILVVVQLCYVCMYVELCVCVCM